MRLATFLFLTTFAAYGQLQTIMEAETAFATKDYARYAVLGEQLLPRTRHPNILYRLAQAYASLGETEKTLTFLNELASRGVSIDVSKNDVLATFHQDTRFAAVFQKFAANATKVEPSVPAFSLPDKQLIPEGIAVDVKTGDFFVSSLAQWKVVKRNQSGSVQDFVGANQYGIWSTLGMKVDPTGKELWVCSAAEFDSLNGYSGIFVFDLKTRMLKKKFILDNKAEQHLFNDIVIDTQGNAYFTDSKPGKLFRIPKGTEQVEEMSAAFLYPNGIAIDDSGENLYVADYTGLTRVHLSSNTFSKVDDNGVTFLQGIDGLLFYKSSLIALQDTGNKDDRVVRFYLDQSGSAIKKVEVLQSYRDDFVIPTTGTIYKGHYYYIANSFLRNLQPDRKIVQPEVLKEPLILKIPLH
jgi:hypothetical protein